MRSKRYEIQFAYLEDTLTGEGTKWYSLRNGASRSRRKAVKNWWEAVRTNQKQRLYRLVDTKTGKVIR